MLSHAAFCSRQTRDQLEVLVINHPLFDAEIVLQGAQLIRFNPKGQDNWFWLSDKIAYHTGKALRGGIPICWPWFGNADKNPEAVKNNILQKDAHGFARSLLWQISAIHESAHQVSVELNLRSNAVTHTYWPHEFLLRAEFIFGKDCQVSLHTHNTCNKTFAFSQALHSYFPTADIQQTRLQGFADTAYIDTLDGWQEKTQQGDIQFAQETDRIYLSHPQVTLKTPLYTRVLSSEHSHSSVVWNPWIEKSKRLGQFALDDYQRMFCVETANAFSDYKTLQPGDACCLSLKLSAN